MEKYIIAIFYFSSPVIDDAGLLLIRGGKKSGGQENKCKSLKNVWYFVHVFYKTGYLE